jgi:hypothetical protein
MVPFHDELTRIVELLNAGEEVDWQVTRDDLIALHNLADEEHQFETVIELYLILMKAIRCNANIDDLNKFDELIMQDYKRFLISENVRDCTDGNIDFKKMKKIAEREIAQGRMDSDDEFYKIVLKFDETNK